jgi:hypothetical protein
MGANWVRRLGVYPGTLNAGRFVVAYASFSEDKKPRRAPFEEDAVMCALRRAVRLAAGSPKRMWASDPYMITVRIWAQALR